MRAVRLLADEKAPAFLILQGLLPHASSAAERGIVERQRSRHLRRPQAGRVHEELARAQIHPSLS